MRRAASDTRHVERAPQTSSLPTGRNDPHTVDGPHGALPDDTFPWATVLRPQTPPGPRVAGATRPVTSPNAIRDPSGPGAVAAIVTSSPSSRKVRLLPSGSPKASVPPSSAPEASHAARVLGR